MTPTDRRTGCIQVLAEINQHIAEYEAILAESVLERAEERQVAAYLCIHRRWRERVGQMLDNA